MPAGLAARAVLTEIILKVIRGSSEPAKPPRRRGPGRPRKRGRARSPAGTPAARPNRQHGSEDAVNLPVDGASVGSFKRCNVRAIMSADFWPLIRQLAIAAPHEALADLLIATLKSTQPMPETGAQPPPDPDPSKPKRARRSSNRRSRRPSSRRTKAERATATPISRALNRWPAASGPFGPYPGSDCISPDDPPQENAASPGRALRSRPYGSRR